MMSEMVDSVAKAMSDKAGLVWDILPDSADMACGHGMPEGCRDYWRAMASIAIDAANKWDDEQQTEPQSYSRGECPLCGGPLPCLTHSQFPHLLELRGAFKDGGKPPFRSGDVLRNIDKSQISTGLDDALQAELDHPPASILGKE
jgi:hypothetical protein